MLVRTIPELIPREGGTARVRGEFSAFPESSATDLSILGRDVLDLFDIIIRSRRRNEVRLLATNHIYQISRQG